MSMASRFAAMYGHDRIGAAEREAFAQTLLEVGPDAPSCCEGWSARDVCIHLVLFERRPDAWFGHMMGDHNERARRYYDGMVQRERERDWPGLVRRFRVGPSFGPLALGAVRNRMFLREYTIHHEDVRRANGMPPRTDIDAVQDAMWSKLPGFVRIVRPSDVGIEAVWPDRDQVTLRRGEPVVTLTGEPLEILLLMFGRAGVARVDKSGPPDVVDRVGMIDAAKRPALPRMAVR